MKAISFLTWLFLMVLQQAFCVAQGEARRHSADPGTLADAVSRIRAVDRASYHHYLREAAQIASRTFVSQDWSKVSDALRRLECPLVEFGESGAGDYFLVQEHAVSFDGGCALNAYVNLIPDDMIPRKLQGHPRRVLEATVVLGTNVGMPYEEFLKQHRFPRDSVLDVVFRSNDVAREGSRWPMVNGLLVYYGTDMERSGNLMVRRSGFHVKIEFNVSLVKNLGEQSMNMIVPSGLDPMIYYSTDGSSRVDCESIDSLGAVQFYERTEKWYGEPSEIEANKRKYLKIP